MYEEVKNYIYELEMVKELYYDESSMFGVYSFKFVNQNDLRDSGVELHPSFYTFVITGTCPRLRPRERRNVAFVDDMTDKYGKGYKFVEVQSTGLTSAESQEEFFDIIVDNDNFSDGVKEIYPVNDTFLEDIVSGKHDLTQVKGIGEATQKRIIKKLSEYQQYSEAIVELAPLGAGIKSIMRLVNSFYNAEELIKAIRNDIYKITRVDGFGFKKVDDLALKKGYAIDSPSRLIAGAIYVLEQMSDKGDTKIKIDTFDDEMVRILGVSEISNDIFSEVLKDDRIRYEDGFICLKKHYDEEVSIAKHIVNLIKEVKPIEGINEVAERIIKETEEREGITFSEGQIKAIYMAINNGFSVLSGYGGTGKTFVVRTVVKIMEEVGVEPIAMALSGRASAVLREAGVENSGTIHRSLKYKRGTGFLHNEVTPLRNEFVILDEASMPNNTLFKSILSAIKPGCRFLIVGDNAQLPPIGHGSVFDTAFNVDVPQTTLTEIHRQAKKSGIITAATEVRNGTQLNSYGYSEPQVFGEKKDMRVFNYIDKTRIYDDIMSVVNRFLKNPMMKKEELQVITAMKKGSLGVPELNKGLQELINPHPKGGTKPNLVSKGVEFREGDRVIQGGNLYDTLGYWSESDYELADSFGSTNVFNGSIGYIKKVEKNGVLVKFEYPDIPNEYIYYSATGDDITRPMGMLDLAYAITTHRSQGSGFKTVIFAFDFSAFMLLSKEFVYTGITRAIDNCLMFVENTALHHAIKTNHGSNRSTYLKELLQNELKELDKNV